MPSIKDYIANLKGDRRKLVQNLNFMGVSSSTETETFSQLAEDVLKITHEAAENDVEFIDYDGFRLYSYSTNDFLNLTEMPATPVHTGLTSDGWNWTLAGAKEHVRKNKKLIIGNQAHTTDNKTRLYIKLFDNELSIVLSLNMSGTCTISWGDNSSNEQMTGSSILSTTTLTHTYSAAGDYVITIDHSDCPNCYFSGTASTPESSLVIQTNGNLLSNHQLCTLCCIRKIELGKQANSNNYSLLRNTSSLRKMSNLESVVIPQSVIDTSTISSYQNLRMLEGTKNLKSIVYPKTSTTFPIYGASNSNLELISLPEDLLVIMSYSFQNTYKLKKFIIPEGVTTIGEYAFSGSNIGPYLKMPGSITTIGARCFADCYNLKIIDFTDHLSIPTITGNNAFLYTYPKILVPEDLYSSWIAADKWSTYADLIYPVDSNGNVLPKP